MRTKSYWCVLINLDDSFQAYFENTGEGRRKDEGLPRSFSIPTNDDGCKFCSISPRLCTLNFVVDLLDRRGQETRVKG